MKLIVLFVVFVNTHTLVANNFPNSRFKADSSLLNFYMEFSFFFFKFFIRSLFVFVENVISFKRLSSVCEQKSFWNSLFFFPSIYLLYYSVESLVEFESRMRKKIGEATVFLFADGIPAKKKVLLTKKIDS